MEALHHYHTWEYIGFGIVVALLLWKGVPGMIGKMLDQRSAAIAAELNEAKRLSAEAAALLADYKKKAAGAEKLIAARMDAAKASSLIASGIKDLGEKLN